MLKLILIVLLVAGCGGESEGIAGSNPFPGSGGSSAIAGTTVDSGLDATGGSSSVATTAQVTLSIQTGLSSYSAAMSSVPGLPLTPAAAGFTTASVSYRWQADFGTFLVWPASTHVIQELGSDATVDNATVYWNYDSIPATQNPVHITLQALLPSGEVLSTSTITLTWNAQGGVDVT